MKIACYLCGKAILTKVSKIAFAGNTFFFYPQQISFSFSWSKIVTLPRLSSTHCFCAS